MSTPTDVLVLGSTGMLGHDLVANAPSWARLTAPSAANGGRLDVTDADALRAVLDTVRPAWVINAAAYTNVEGAEDDAAAANAVNGTGVAILAHECTTRGIRVLHYSTDYVFAGDMHRSYREDDATGPLNAYGRSKLLGERALLERPEARHLVVRTQWLFGRAGRSFPRTMWERARNDTPTRVVDDQTGAPTYTVDLADASWRLIGNGRESGTFHVTNRGPATWYAVARRVFERSGNVALLMPCSSTDFPMKARRPSFSVLDTARFESTFGQALPRWEDAIDRFLDSIERA